MKATQEVAYFAWALRGGGHDGFWTSNTRLFRGIMTVERHQEVDAIEAIGSDTRKASCHSTTSNDTMISLPLAFSVQNCQHQL